MATVPTNEVQYQYSPEDLLDILKTELMKGGVGNAIEQLLSEATVVKLPSGNFMMMKEFCIQKEMKAAQQAFVAAVAGDTIQDSPALKKALATLCRAVTREMNDFLREEKTQPQNDSGTSPR